MSNGSLPQSGTNYNATRQVAMDHPPIPSDVLLSTLKGIPGYEDTVALMVLAEIYYRAKIASDEVQRQGPEGIFIRLQLGHEVGLKPLQSLNNIMVVNNRPTIWGDAMLALCMRSKLFDQSAFLESFEGSKENPVAVCTVRRLPNGNIVTRRYSRDMAKKANLLGKKGDMYVKYLFRMLQRRARSWALTDTFPDILQGLCATEEMLTIEGKPVPPLHGPPMLDVSLLSPGEFEDDEAEKLALSVFDTLPPDDPPSVSVDAKVEPEAVSDPSDQAEPAHPLAPAPDTPQDVPDPKQVEKVFKAFWPKAKLDGYSEEHFRALIEACNCNTVDLIKAMRQHDTEPVHARPRDT